MRCRQVGASGLWASEVGLGLWKWGDPSYDGSRVGDHAGFKILDRALELGVFFWDTANSYNGGSGNSERLIGRYFSSRGRKVRDKVVLATKITNPVRYEHEEKADFTPNQRGASRGYIMKAVDDSLRRLQTDYIDLLYLHSPTLDEKGCYETPLEETWGAMDDLISQGKVRYIAVSNHNAKQIEEAMEALSTVSKDASRRIVVVQNPYNLIERDGVSKEKGGDERAFLEFCREKRIGVVPYFPLASGLLTGRYRRDNLEKVQGKIIYDGMQERFLTDYNLRVVELLDEFVRERGITMAQLAIAWLLTHDEVCSVITGVTRMEHLEDNVKATEVVLSEDDLRIIDEILERAKKG
ncbi:MAG: aldo/keto reductase [Chloroflexi bacterium]|nr:MAG: aldo/keto reductase [Chloroflexota bacterium]